MVAVSVLCAPSDEEARWLAGPSALTTLQLRTGRLGPIATPEEAAAYPYTPEERALVEAATATHLIGDPAVVHQGLVDLHRRTGADEIMLSTRVHSLDARVQSLTLVAESWAGTEAVAAPTPTSTSAR
jgi:alkanesulfonate monooxygenase SsuD/methylene tetrahydromethanopterin reductase-like flavin-dependent oxidoreductase (luciferase family)